MLDSSRHSLVSSSSQTIFDTARLPSLESPSKRVVAQRLPVDGLPDLPPFFCLGGAGEFTAYLDPLARAVGRSCYLCRLDEWQDGSSSEPSSMLPLAQRYVEVIKAKQPWGPYVIGGHSYGGLVAYEVARQLRALGDRVSRVIMIDTYVPVPGQNPPPWDKSAILHELCSIDEHSFTPQGFFAESTVQPVSPQQISCGSDQTTVMLRYQAHIAASLRYRPPPSDVSLTLIKANGIFPQSLIGARYVELYRDDPNNGWEHIDVRELELLQVSEAAQRSPRFCSLNQVASAIQDVLGDLNSD